MIITLATENGFKCTLRDEGESRSLSKEGLSYAEIIKSYKRNSRLLNVSHFDKQERYYLIKYGLENSLSKSNWSKL